MLTNRVFSPIRLYIHIYQTNLRRRELQTTDTELRAMAADAIHGSMDTPSGENTSAAIGRPVNCSNTFELTLPLLL